MKRLLFMIAVGLAVTAVSSQAQSLNAGQIQFTLDGQAVGTLLLPTVANGSTAGGYTWTLPDASGELSLGGANSWEVGGQNLGGTGLLGSWDNEDVTLIANNTPRMTLIGASNAVLLPTQTELRLGDAAGGHYSAIVSPADIEPVAGVDGSITYVLPSNLPGGDDVRLKVASVVGNVVTFEYTNPNTTGQIGFKKANGFTVTNGQTVNDYLDVAGMSFQVFDNSIYSFEAVLQVESATNGADVLVQLGVPKGPGNQGAMVYVPGVDVKYYIMNLTNNNPVNTGGEVHNVDATLTEGETYILKGYIETGIGAPTPDGAILQIQIRANQANPCTVTAKSSVQLITE